MFDILQIIPNKKKQTQSGWITFNGVCCHHRGHNPDKRGRAGLKFTDQHQWLYHCFNCGFKCGWVLGSHFSKNLKTLLTWCGLDQDTISRYSFQSFSQRSVVDLHKKWSQETLKTFKEVQLPLGARPLDPGLDSVHIQYIQGRGLDPYAYPYHVVDGETRTRLIVPYYWQEKIVGYTSRFYDNRTPKYISEQQSGYVFNIDGQRENWGVCIAVEGQFDALSIGGCAYMGNGLNPDQIRCLRSLNRKVIVVPDRDKSGLEVCSTALDAGFHISLPEWGSGVKDVNDAVKLYGKLPTLLSILQSSTSSKIKVELARKKLL